MCTLKQYNHRKSDSMNNQVQSYTRPKRDIKPQLNLFYEKLCNYFDNKMDLSYFKWITHKWLPNRGSNADSLSIHVHG